MSYNRKALKTATNELGKAKAPAKPKDIITDPMGQWKYPGENTRIPGSDITMQGVDYPVWAQPNIGQPQMMYPGQEYQFPGADYVDEFPQGGNEEYYEDELSEEQIAELRAGGYVVEDISVPQLTQAKKGGSLKKYSRSIEATNKLFRVSPLLKKAKSKKKKIFDPSSNYFDVGGIPNLPLREGRKAYERLGYTDNDRMAVAEEGGFLPQAQAGKATTSLILNPYEQGMFNTNVHAQGSNKPSFGFGVQRSNMFPRWAKENDVKTSMSGQVQIPYAMDRGPAIKGTARTAYSPNAGRGNPLDFTTQAQLEAGYNPNYGFNANVMAWPYAHGSNVPEARWKENKYYPGAVRAGVGPQAGFSYASDNKTFNGDDYMNPNRAGVHYGGKGFVEYTPTDWLKLKLEAQGMFDPIANKRDENAEIEGTKWKFSPGVNVSATVPLNFNKAKVKPNLQRKAQLYNDEIDGNFVKQASINSGPMRKNGGNINNDYIEIDADDNDIANYIAQGYEVEELPQAQYAGQTPFVHPNAGATQVLFQKPAPVKPNSKYDPKAPVNYQTKLKPVVADNTRDVTADEALAAVQNAAYMKSPEYKAKQKAEKEAQAKFEKKQWANYNKMSLGEKVLDRTNAALNQPLVMASNLLMGEQAYIPGMAEGLGEDNINYDEYLKATGQSRGLSVNDVFNVVNPGNWGGHAGREYGKGNYVQGATELGLGLLGLKGAPMGEEIAKRYADKLINLEQKAGQKLGTESGLLSNAYKLNPVAVKENPNVLLHRVQKPGQTEEYIMNHYGKETLPGWGRAFSSDPTDMAYYSYPTIRRDRGYTTDPEILRLNVPKKDIEQYNIYNFDKSQKAKGLPPYFAGSNKPTQEFIMPINDIIKADKFGIQDLDNLYEEYKKFNTPHWLKGYKEVPKELPGSSNVNFTSDINWADWNKEIPSNKSLMDEYNTIEETSKANGTWMKNPDGSKFEGTPEQFIQQQSINFKKAYPKGFDKSYRGVTYSNPDFSMGTTNFSGDRGIFTGNYDLAKGYSSRGSEEILTPNSLENTGGVYELIHPKGKQIDYNTLLSDWMDIDLNKASSKSNLQDRLTTMKKHLKRVQDVEGISPEVINSYNKNISLLQNYINNFDTYNSDPEALEKMKNVLGDVTTTDDVAEYISSTDLNKITLRNIIDGDIGDVTIVNNKPGNYLKSAIGNNGMFDLNNPNIYKSILPFIGVAGAASLHNSQQEKLKLKQGGSLELDLTPEEIQAYINAGYTIEDID